MWAVVALGTLLGANAVASMAATKDGTAVKGESKLAATDIWSHAYAAYGKPKYPPGFSYFDYVNPDAPKGGTLQLQNPDRRSSFDKFNPFTIKGQSPAGLTTLMFETLTVRSGDEPATIYGMLAEEMLIAPDKSSITFRLNPKAKFTNGDRVTAADVKHSFEMLTGKGASPGIRVRLQGVERAVVQDDRTIRFELKERVSDTIFNIGNLPVFSRKWGVGPDGTAKKFDDIINEYPITSGPYTIAAVDSGRRIDFARDRNY